MRIFLVGVGIIALGLAGKVAFAGLGAGTFNIATWEVVLLALVGAALILLGWPWQRRNSPDLENEPNEETDPQGDA